ncbi:MAG: AbrB/MazE/SpoVT family DNA-binding domain-containing protein [Gemmatimonadetes bacterium]|nr:AbrB/MazE/SpoVT family DNA-binding domain-containing protein [Gemmatimonadota bacterium]
MAKITSKLQVTIPKAIAQQYGLRPGSEIAFLAAGEGIRVIPAAAVSAPGVETRLELFDRATERQRARQGRRRKGRSPRSRGWRREDLYTRGVPGRH